MTDRQKIYTLMALLAGALLLLGAIATGRYIDARIALAIRAAAGGETPAYPVFVGAVRQDFTNFNRRLAQLEPSPIPTTAPPGP